MRAKYDCWDADTSSHVEHFLNELPEKLQLDKVLELSLEDPIAALRVISEVRAALAAEQHKARSLGRLVA